MKQKFLILGALFFGILSAYLTWSLIDDEKTKIAKSMEEVELLRARTTLSPLTEIKDGDLERLRVMRPKSMANRTNEVLAASYSSVKGRKLKYQVKQGDFIRWNDIDIGMEEGTGFARHIEENTRAVTLSCSAITSVANLIRPRDRVDIIGTFKFPETKGDQMMDTVTLTVLQDVMILSVGGEYGQTLPVKGAIPIRSYGNVTVQVSPAEAELLIFAQQKGTLTFTLRKPTDTRTIRDFNNVNWEFLMKNLSNYAKDRDDYNRLRRNPR